MNDTFGIDMDIDTDEKVTNLERAFREAEERDEINRQRLANGEGIHCRICDGVALPDYMFEGVCPSCNGLIEEMLMRARTLVLFHPLHRKRAEKMAFVIRFHAEALRRLSE